MKSITEDARDGCEKYRDVIEHLYSCKCADSNAARVIKFFAGEIE